MKTKSLKSKKWMNVINYMSKRVAIQIQALRAFTITHFLLFFLRAQSLRASVFIPFLFFGFLSHAQLLTEAATLKMTTSRDTVNIAEPFEAIVELNLSAGTRFDSSLEVCAFDTTFDVATDLVFILTGRYIASGPFRSRRSLKGKKNYNWSMIHK